MLNSIRFLSLTIFLLGSIVSCYAQDVLSNDSISPNKWRIEISGGSAYQLGSTKAQKESFISQGFSKEAVDDFMKEMRLGMQLSGQAHYFINDELGIGLDYQYNSASGTMNGYISNDGNTILTDVEDDLFTNYIGLSLFAQTPIIEKKLYLTSQVSAGAVFLREETLFAFNPILVTAQTFGSNLELGLDYYLCPSISLGLKIGYFRATVTKIDVETVNRLEEIKLDKEQYLSLGKLGATAGLRFYF